MPKFEVDTHNEYVRVDYPYQGAAYELLTVEQAESLAQDLLNAAQAIRDVTCEWCGEHSETGNHPGAICIKG